MSTASKPPADAASAPAGEYKAHFEMWDEAAVIHDADAAPVRNGSLRPWTKPALTPKPVSLPRKITAPPADIDRRPWSEIPVAALYLGLFAIGAFLTVLLMGPWEYSTSRHFSKPLAMATAKTAARAKPVSAKPVPAKPPKIAVAAIKPVPKLIAAPKVASVPEAGPSSAIAARPVMPAPAKMPVASSSYASSHVGAAPNRPAAQPSAAVEAPKLAAAQAPAIIPLPPPEVAHLPAVAPNSEPPSPAQSAPARVASAPLQLQRPAIEVHPSKQSDEEPERSYPDEEESDELAPVRAMLLESSIRSQLAYAGFTDIGVSMTEDGDVYLNGTFLNEADQDKAMAMIREHHGVHDIYFSGSVWHDVNSPNEQEAAPVTAAVPNPVSKPTEASQAASPQEASASTPDAKPIPASHAKIAHSKEFPVTAAEAPAPVPRYAAPAQPTVIPTPAPKRHSIFPFRLFN